ncbi:sodium:proton antiporter NhaD [Flagellatimonas centrodinii]|uniref:sodium:proton antiporter NhaD n=1 Tax=Flagellatimonas centrodinii TaxID=2806210 RepID=UPI001FF77425|nr:sodium:proton antiporter NhaD [Flagellatimonas centrodinii]ULQ47022.1 sodium:proton antiporter NhaD [Flagellatimonas centrodinii]
MRALLLSLLCLVPGLAAASEAAGVTHDFTAHWIGLTAVVIFVLAYTLVVMEEWLHLRKSIPVLMAAGLIWTLIGLGYAQLGDFHTAGETVRHSLLEFGELFLFLLVAMTYINTLEERGIFDALRGWLVSRGFSLRTLFWLTGLLAFFISPVADNMTTALVMASVAMAVGKGHPGFVVVACINIVVAANAGGAWSPFGDITTLMVWQKGVFPAHEFLALFLPSVVNWLVPAAIMSYSLPKATPEALQVRPEVLRGGYLVIFMFIGTIALTVSLHSFLHLPPALGMMGGLGLLKLYSYYLNQTGKAMQNSLIERGGLASSDSDAQPLNVFDQVARAEWDTLLFFYGIIMCVGGLGTLGYLALGSEVLYVDLGPTVANVLVGVVSAVIDNIPVMFAVLTMFPDMSDGQWLLVTLTAGVGGSLLSVGSAAGVAVMGQARGVYTFFAHLRWSWAIALGYAASIAVHFWVNKALFLLH